MTSLKRESTLLEVPFSVAAPTEDELRKRGVDDIEGVARNVAGFSVQNLAPARARSRSAASPPARSRATSPASRSRWAPTSTSR